MRRGTTAHRACSFDWPVGMRRMVVWKCSPLEKPAGVPSAATVLAQRMRWPPVARLGSLMQRVPTSFLTLVVGVGRSTWTKWSALRSHTEALHSCSFKTAPITTVIRRPRTRSARTRMMWECSAFYLFPSRQQDLRRLPSPQRQR